eukprot:455942-Amphidinium_carterae.1
MSSIAVLVVMAHEAHQAVAEAALQTSRDLNLPPVDPAFPSTADTWNRLRDKDHRGRSPDLGIEQ